ncbi:C-type lectin domain family 4 member M-like [Astatotilapia calliptera]|uniref:C-type lectin domain family 4 member M-like n=1 Tax=Astatotilapia calliptera TaxID=8154 RepID=UPI000E42C64B|nr:C-type lectin domain family 4 member M-like [Astatotilapia calliptera]
MSSIIDEDPELSMNVKYSKGEDRGERLEGLVLLHENVDSCTDRQVHVSTQDGDILVSLEKEQLKDEMEVSDALNKSENNKLHFKHNKLNHSYNELQTEHQETKRLNSQLQEEVKKLKEKIEEKCPEEWTRFGCSCYFKSTVSETWSDSRRACQDKGADLVMINSKEEQEFVSKFGGFSWIGLRAKQTSGRSKWEWEWVDGSALTETFRGTAWSDPYSGHYAVCCDGDGKWTQSLEYDNYDNNYDNNYVYMTFICEK